MVLPVSVAGWPRQLTDDVLCLIARGENVRFIASRAGVPFEAVQELRDHWRAHEMLWPGPREVAEVFVLACRLTNEDPLISIRPTMSRAKAYAYRALMQAYPAVPRESIALLVGVVPFGGRTSDFTRNFAMRFALKHPPDRWWSVDTAAKVRAAASKVLQAGPVPAWWLECAKAVDRGGMESPVEPAPAELVVRADESVSRPASALSEDEPDMLPETEGAPKRPLTLASRASESDAIGLVDCSDAFSLSNVALAVFALGAGRCKWPDGDPRNGGKFRFCDGDAIDGQPYCKAHSLVGGTGMYGFVRKSRK